MVADVNEPLKGQHEEVRDKSFYNVPKKRTGNKIFFIYNYDSS